MKRLLESIDSISKPAKKSAANKFPGYWKGTDSASKAKSKMVGCEESVIKELAKESKNKSTERRLAEEYEQFKQQDINDRHDTVGFSVNSEKAYNAVMSRFGDYIDHDETSGIMYVPARMWANVEEVAFDADGVGAEQDDGYENPDSPEQEVDEASTNDYFKRRKDEEDRIAGTKAPAKRTPRQTDYEKKRKEQSIADRLRAADQKLKQLKEYGAVAGAPGAPSGGTAQAGTPSIGASSVDPKKQAQVAQTNLAKIATTDKSINPTQANQALQTIGAAGNPTAPMAGTQLAQTKNLADLVGDALADPQKGGQVASMLQQVAKAQGQK